MPNLINRDPPGRLSCIHAFLSSLWYRFATNSFTGVRAKHEVGGENNPIEYCKCSQEYSPGTALVTGEEKYCPFLRAGSSKSYCYLINSNLLDTQKSKAVGEAIQALEALGLCRRTLNTLKRLRRANLTAAGTEIAKTDFYSQRAKTYYDSQIVNYGPIVGFLHLLDIAGKTVIKHTEMSKYMGRPNNYDKVVLSTGDEVILNDGDAKDARTRTSGALQAWLTYIGYIRPSPHEFEDTFLKTDQFYSDPRNKLGYSQVYVNKNRVNRFFEMRPLVERPLSHDFFIKGIGAAREYSQRSPSGKQLENLALKELGPRVRNRRFLLMYLYSLASLRNKGLNLEKVSELSNFKGSPFVVDTDTHNKVILDSEVDFLTIAGAPFLRSKEEYGIIYPRVRLNPNQLKIENPFLASQVDKLLSNMEIFA